jgi:hypothetical protein
MKASESTLIKPSSFLLSDDFLLSLTFVGEGAEGAAAANSDETDESKSAIP